MDKIREEDAALALRTLADGIGKKWKKVLDQNCEGLGHLHDVWNEMHEDMSAIVCLEHYIADNTEAGTSGVDFGKVKGIDYIE